jgi:hypothetical protein
MRAKMYEFYVEDVYSHAKVTVITVQTGGH